MFENFYLIRKAFFPYLIDKETGKKTVFCLDFDNVEDAEKWIKNDCLSYKTGLFDYGVEEREVKLV